MPVRLSVLTVLNVVCLSASLFAQRLDVPRRHDRPPGPPLSPEEAVARMTVPEGFSVEIVAAEPDIMNPVAMCIDEKGRFWVTESFEYPRREPGPGRDRVKVLEDTDGDGRVDKVTVFADGLNIPSGIAVGYGGVWVANSPDILFMQDTDGDLKADKIEKVVTGFGRTDTHELPNSLTWGPDGWLYGLNGVFNHSHVKSTESNPNYDPDHEGWQFTCAMFRIHPRTREFEIFAEGTSNPWGIAINDEGDFFISACVIDHLWHIVETGYYIRQGGPYPPHTWPMRSIVDHKHQKAAYCGIEWFDSDAYPEEYRNVLYMGNIHGGCINADIVERSGSTYKGKPHPGFPAKRGAWADDEYDLIRKTGDPENPKLADFLTANDAWFMPVVQKTGPDGCLYILDWYDRYHCYQDANADPEGVDRGKGRLYRVVYQGHEHKQFADIGALPDNELVGLLDDPNVYKRQTAQRLLGERAHNATKAKLMAIAIDEQAPLRHRLYSLWAWSASRHPSLVQGNLLDNSIEDDAKHLETIKALRQSENPLLKSWAIRLSRYEFPASRLSKVPSDLRALSEDPSPQVRLQAVIAAACDVCAPTLDIILNVAESADDDLLLQHVSWNQLRSVIRGQHGSDFAKELSKRDLSKPGLQAVVLRGLDLLCEETNSDKAKLTPVLNAILSSATSKPDYKRKALQIVSERIQTGAISQDRIARLKDHLRISTSGRKRLEPEVTVFDALLGSETAIADVREQFLSQDLGQKDRLAALQTLVAANDDAVLDAVETTLSTPDLERGFRMAIVENLGRVNNPQVAELLLANFSAFEPAVRPKAIEVLTQRDSWSIVLLHRIKAKEIDKDALNLNQLKRVALFKNEQLQKLVTETYGAVRQDRRSDRQHVINRQRDFLRGTPGDPGRGQAAFKKVCGQCHKIYGEGAEVGPDITRNGRNNWNQLLQNVFDPSAVIGPGYQARTLLTDDGRVLTGLPVEESGQRVVLKIQGGKTETIPRDQIEAYTVSEMSLMPEDLEKQLKPQEIADLFAFLALDKPPSDPSSKLLPGAPNPKSR